MRLGEFLIRLDDASEYMDVDKWNRIENLLDCLGVKPLVGIIPNNQDEDLVNKYSRNNTFWDTARSWQQKGWTLALHGCTHVYSSKCGGINPVNHRSEFAGISLEKQRNKIADGLGVFSLQNISANAFFAPAHTFDFNTLEALKVESTIRIICDTIANDVYMINGFYFIPQQSGRARRLPFKLTTFCYHPNKMSEQDYNHLEGFIRRNKKSNVSFDDIELKDRYLNAYDRILKLMYFTFRSIRSR